MIRVTFLVNGTDSSAMGERARGLSAHLGPRFAPSLLYRGERKIRAIAEFTRALARTRPDLCYVVDPGYSGVLAALVFKSLFRRPVVLDTGDFIEDLARSSGMRGPLGVWMTGRLESLAHGVADLVVVRGTLHKRMFGPTRTPVEVVQDGVDSERFAPQDSSALRRRLGLDGALAVGVLGASVHAPKLGICYGWELVELLGLVRDLPVRGVMIGDGSGIPVLKSRARELGVEDRIAFLGRLPYSELPAYLSALDVCLSTQTNDRVGNARTTGKLPLYLAAGRFVLASRVGEASLVLPEEMLVEYEGVVDRRYPEKLAERVRALAARPELLRLGQRNVQLARDKFDYRVLGPRLASALVPLASGPGGG